MSDPVVSWVPWESPVERQVRQAIERMEQRIAMSVADAKAEIVAAVEQSTRPTGASIP